MAVFYGQTITDKGRELLARVLASEGEFQFTGAAFGDQKHTGDITIIEELKNKKLDLLVMDTVNDRGTVKVTVQITNATVEESFYTEEFGIYAKIKGDTNEILYSYATATKPDAIPNNKLGTTFESIHEIYMDISSNTEATISVDESILFLTLDIANKNYTKTGLIARGVLEGRTSLEANKQYQDSNGEWHKNIGGDRAWNGSADTDGQFIQLTWDKLYEGKEPKFTKNTGFNLNISHVINSASKILVASAYAVKLAYDKALEAIGFTNTNKNAIQNNTEQIENLFYFRNEKTKNEVSVTGSFDGSVETVANGVSSYNVSMSLDRNNNNGWISGVATIDLSKFLNKMPSKSDSTHHFLINVNDIIPDLPNIGNATFGTGNVYRANTATKDLTGTPIEVTWQQGGNIKLYTTDYCYFNNGVAVMEDLVSLGVSFFIPLYTLKI